MRQTRLTAALSGFSALPALLLTAALMGLTACDRGDAQSGGGDHDDGHHAHTAKYGGKLIEVGDHFANLEAVLNEEAGELTLYAMGPHAENPRRLAQETIEATVTAGGETFDMTLNARANELTGETVGDSSQFVGSHEKLKGVHAFKIVVKDVTIGGKAFETLEADLDFDHDHADGDHDHAH